MRAAIADPSSRAVGAGRRRPSSTSPPSPRSSTPPSSTSTPAVARRRTTAPTRRADAAILGDDAERAARGLGQRVHHRSRRATSSPTITSSRAPTAITVTLGDGRAFRADVVGVDPAIDVALLQDPRATAAAGGAARRLRHAARGRVGVRDRQSARATCTRSRSASSASSAASCSTRASTPTSRPTPPSASATAAGRSSTRAGEVVGITTAVSAQASNIGFAIPISQVVAVLPQLREHGTRVARLHRRRPDATSTPGAAARAAARAGARRARAGRHAGHAGRARRAAAVRRRSSRVDGRDDPLRRRARSATSPAGSPARRRTLEVWRDGERSDVSGQARRAAAAATVARGPPTRPPTCVRSLAASRRRSA